MFKNKQKVSQLPKTSQWRDVVVVPACGMKSKDCLAVLGELKALQQHHYPLVLATLLCRRSTLVSP